MYSRSQYLSGSFGSISHHDTSVVIYFFKAYIAYSKIQIHLNSFKISQKNHFFPAYTHEVMVLSQHQNFYLWYLVEGKKNKDVHPLTHFFC